MEINNRKNDSIVEREIAKFLDEKLYSNKTLFKEFARTDDKEEQISGSDVVLSTSDGVLYRKVVDEKVAARYANMGLNTFSLELSFIGKNGNRRSGWFIDNTKKTEYYLLGWIVRADIPKKDDGSDRYDTNEINQWNIKELDWALVSRQRIMDFLESKGWTLDKLALQDKKIRENGKVKTKEFIDDVSFRYSDAYVEKPINILLKKDTFMKLSHMHGTIVCEEEQKEGREKKYHGDKIILESKIVNDNYTQFLYDNYDIQNRDITTTEVPMPSKEDMEEMNKSHWNIMLICGKSGSGKSTILKEIGNVIPIKYDYNKAVISQFEGYSEEDACDLLNGVGLSSVPNWLRKPNELSNGERARLDIAKSIYDAKGGVVILDEFTSVVNRAAAKSMSFALQRYARQKDLKIVIASCHFDIIEWLNPNYIFNLNHKDENGNVELEKMVYSDDAEYKNQQYVKETEVLSEPRVIN
jgi:ABC-type lipoprotein export system ATPase subunit